MYRLYAIISFFIFTQISVAQVVIENSIVDLGTIIEAKGKVSTSFYLRGGADTSEIIDVITSCGCATVISKEKKIYPGKQIKIDASYDPEGRLGFFSKGIQILVNTNGVEQKLNLILKGRVIRSSKELLKQKVDISLIEVKPALLKFWHQYDTTDFHSAELTNFLNTATYVIDKNNFMTLETKMRVRDSIFIPEARSWLHKLKRAINVKLEGRGYKSYQVSYGSQEVIVDSIAELGHLTMLVKNYSQLEFQNHQVQFSYKSKGFEEQLFCTSPKGGDLKQFRAEIDSLLENRFLIMDTVTDILFIARGTEKELAKSVKFIAKWKKKYGDRVSYQLNKENDSIFHFSFGFSEDKLRLQAMEVDLITNLNKSEPIYPSVQISGNNLKETPELHLLKTMIKNYEDTLQFKLIYSFGYINEHKKPSKTSLLKELAIIAKQFKDYLEAQGVVYVDIETVLYEKQVLRNPKFGITIVPFKQKSEVKNLIKPYHVIFNSNQFSFDEESYVFKNFIRSISTRISLSGYVELIIESSSSNAPTRSDLSSVQISFKRRDHAVQVMRKALANQGIDPNRLIIKESKAFVAGPKYDNDYFLNKEKYKKYQYLKMIPTSAL